MPKVWVAQWRADEAMADGHAEIHVTTNEQSARDFIIEMTKKYIEGLGDDPNRVVWEDLREIASEYPFIAYYDEYEVAS